MKIVGNLATHSLSFLTACLRVEKSGLSRGSVVQHLISIIESLSHNIIITIELLLLLLSLLLLLLYGGNFGIFSKLIFPKSLSRKALRGPYVFFTHILYTVYMLYKTPMIICDGSYLFTTAKRSDWVMLDLSVSRVSGKTLLFLRDIGADLSRGSIFYIL